MMSYEAEGKNSQAGAEVEHDRSPSRPVVYVKGLVLSSQTLLFGTGLENSALEVDAKKSNSP